MVPTAVNGSPGSTAAPAAAPALGDLPAGNYTLVGWDMDTTGRRLIDEICQIGAYTPDLEFSQYIMPHGNLNPGARRRHNIRVVTIGRYRMLKDNISNKVLKTKSEISALTEFLDWLQKQKGDSDGVILVLHEPKKVTPPMLLEALRRHNLTDKFKSIVSGFADGQALAADKCSVTVKSFGLRVMAKVLLDADWALESAAERASAAYKVAQHLSEGEQQELVAGTGDASSASKKNMAEVVRAYTRSTDKEMKELFSLKELLDKQNAFRPVFGPLLIRTSREERLRAATLRRLLVEADLDYQKLKSVWETDKLTGLENQLACLKVSAKEDQVKDLVDILDCHFDPAKEPKGPKPRAPRPRPVKNQNGAPAKAGPAAAVAASAADESGTSSPDTTSGSPTKLKADVPAPAIGKPPVTNNQ